MSYGLVVSDALGYSMLSLLRLLYLVGLSMSTLPYVLYLVGSHNSLSCTLLLAWVFLLLRATGNDF